MRRVIRPEWLAVFGFLVVAGMLGLPAVLAESVKSTSGLVASEIPATVYPDATNTGVPAGVVLTRATRFILDEAGATVSGLDFRGPVTITAANVTLTNCRITASGWAALDIRGDGVTIENCEIDGQAAEGIRGISVSGNNVSIRASNVHNVEDGIYLAGSSKISIENNYVHDLLSHWDGPHYDGIATDGGISDVVIRGNTVINPHHQTSAVMLSNYFGPVSGVRVEANRLVGGGYTVYADGQFGGGPVSNISLLRNKLGRGFYGYTAISKNVPGFSGNTDDVTGTLIDP